MLPFSILQTKQVFLFGELPAPVADSPDAFRLLGGGRFSREASGSHRR
jgi:hypothetical protein